MSQCNVQQQPDGRWRCTVCGYVSKKASSIPLIRKCADEEVRAMTAKTLVHKINDQNLPGETFYRCAGCGELSPPIKDGEPVWQHECKSESRVLVPPESKVPLYRKISNFAAAYAEHLIKGSPESTKEEVIERFKICSACPSKMYNDTSGTCGHCGCYINLYMSHQSLNKLAWADQECGLGHWGKIEK